MKTKKISNTYSDSYPKMLPCWEILHCDEKKCPVYLLKEDLRCWLVSGTHCRKEIQGKFIEKMEMCVNCKPFSINMNVSAMKETMAVISRQFKEYRNAIEDREIELRTISNEMAIGISETFEGLRKIASGDPTVRIDEKSGIEVISKLKHVVNVTAAEIGEIVNQSHEFAIVLADHFDTLHRVSKGDLKARVVGESELELLESLKKVTNEMIESISNEILKREKVENELHRSYDDMEQRVKDRTAELRNINERLWHEITERRKAEENLRQAELRYRTIADFTHDWEYWETPDKTLSYVSPSSERITGYKASEFITEPTLLDDIIIPADKDIWEKHHHTTLREQDLQDITFRIRRKDGTVCWIEHVCQPVIDSDGVFLGTRASNRDITKRKQAEEKLRDALSLLSTTLESTADGILAEDVQGNIMSFNQKFLKMWHIPQSLMVEQDFPHLLQQLSIQLEDPENFLDRVQKLRDQYDSEKFDILMFTDGRVFEYYSHPQRIGNTIIGRVWSFRDITERKKAEDALRESEQLLLQAHKMEAIGRLAAGIAHEINNPLAIINEKAGLMKDFFEFSGEEEFDKSKFLALIDGIVESVSRCRTITHRLLGFSRRVDVAYNTTDLNDTVREAIAFVEKEILYKNIHLEMNLLEDVPSIMSDKGQLQQVFLNIINNAVDAVDKGGTITVTTGRKDEKSLTVSIQDNGPGISEHVQKHIFEPFYTTKDKERGTGLGLSISYGIIKKLGGNIFVKTTVNEGTTFTIEIPVDVEKNEEGS